MSDIQNTNPTIHSIKVLKALLKASEKPRNTEFKLAHYFHIREKQIAVINALIKEKKLRFRPVGKSKVRYYIIFL